MVSCTTCGSSDVVEAHCYFVDIGRTDREQIHDNDCRTLRPQRPLSTVYKTKGNCSVRDVI